MSRRSAVLRAGAVGTLVVLAVGEELWPVPVCAQQPSTVDARGVYEGPNRSWWPNGQMRRDLPYHDGVPEGTAVFWYPDGQIKCKTPHHDGKLHGVDRCWHPNGKLKSEVRFDMDRAVGVGRYWDERGRLERTRDFARDPLPIPESAR